jgi:hypothetical protein
LASVILRGEPCPALLAELEDELKQIETCSDGHKRWRVREYLGGRPGKTVVVLAKDAHLGLVALKCVAILQEKGRARFEREVKMLDRRSKRNCKTARV